MTQTENSGQANMTPAAPVSIFIENRQNKGTNPNTTVQLPNDGGLYNFQDLKRDPVYTPILATHLTMWTERLSVGISGGALATGIQGGTVETGKPLDVTAGGGPVDISTWSAMANRHGW